MEFTQFFINFGIEENIAILLNSISLSFILFVIAVTGYWLTKIILMSVIQSVIRKSKTNYDDIFLKKKVFDNLSHIVPAIILVYGVNFITHNAVVVNIVDSVAYSYLIFSVMIVLNRLLDASNEMYEIYAEKKQLSVHIKQYVQVVKVAFWIISAILVLSILLNKKPGAVFAGLGAMTAVLLLVFKDSILSLVASIQLSAYEMVKVGDWITVPSRGIDGDVMDISLNTIKIRNFDKTISTLPTYALVQESFVNWHGMEMSGGRRIKRAIYIDENSIKLCTAEMIDKYKKIHFVSKYVTEKQNEIDIWNRNNNIPEPVEINGRAQTNIGIFRKYIENYLRNNFRVFKKYKKEKFTVDGKIIEKFVINAPEEIINELGEGVKMYFSQLNGKTVLNEPEKFLLEFSNNYKLENGYIYKLKKVIKSSIVNSTTVDVVRYEKIPEKDGKFCDDLTVLVRQLPPTEKGLPIEVYVFTSTTDWIRYEEIQSDLFDHLFAVIHEFDLRVFQEPSSSDIIGLGKCLPK